MYFVYCEFITTTTTTKSDRCSKVFRQRRQRRWKITARFNYSIWIFFMPDQFQSNISFNNRLVNITERERLDFFHCATTAAVRSTHRWTLPINIQHSSWKKWQESVSRSLESSWWKLSEEKWKIRALKMRNEFIVSYHTSNCIKMRRVSNKKLIDVDIKSCFSEEIEIIDDMHSIAVSAYYWVHCVDKSRRPFSLPQIRLRESAAHWL